MKEQRGHFVSKYGKIGACPPYLTMWNDSKIVSMLSTFLSADPMGIIRRYGPQKKQHEGIQCSYVIQEYNRYMGAVDLIDSYIDRYHILMRSRKWYYRIFHHLVDVAVINLWLLHKRTKQSNIKLIDFRADFGSFLYQNGINTPSRGRLQSSPIFLPVKRRPTMQTVPSTDIRRDGYHHFPSFDTKNRCKNPGWKGFSMTKCIKCNVTLCYTGKKKLFP